MQYDFNSSLNRLDLIAQSGPSSLENPMHFPTKEELNNYSVTSLYGTVLWIHFTIKEENNRLKNQIFRAIVTEVSTILKSNSQCRDIIACDYDIWGIFETPLKSDIASVINDSARLNVLQKIINSKFVIKNSNLISIGIAITFDSLDVQLIESINEDNYNFVWSGSGIKQAKNQAKDTCASDTGKVRIQGNVFINLSDEDKSFFNKMQNGWYESNFVNAQMNNWVKEQ